MRFVLLALALCLCFSVCAQASLCRLYLAEQYDWENEQGFYLDFEGASLAMLPVFLAVGDGANWRFPSHVPGFEFDRDYQFRAVLFPGAAELYLDDLKVIESAGNWTPAPGDLRVYERPGWANEPGDWVGNVSDVAVILTREGAEVARREFAFGAPRPTPLLLFQPDQPSAAALAALPGDTVTIEVRMRFSRAALDPWKPFLDPFEQCREADWPEKVTGEADLVADIAAEEARLATLPPSEDYDPYGGYFAAGWGESPTGFFRVTRRDGYWWLLTPLGNPCFYLGVSVFPAQAWDMTGVTGRESLFETLPATGQPHSSAWSRDVWGVVENMDYFSFYAWNLIRKYGDSWWEEAEERGIRRLAHWGFSGGSKWGAPATVVSTPVLSRGNTPNLVDHPDVFDPAVQSAFRADLAAQITPHLDDPFILGWSVGSERPELITSEETQAVLGLASTTPGRRALLDYAVDQLYGESVSALAAAWGVAASTRTQLYATSPTPPPADLEQMRRYYLDRYYQFCYQAVKEIDPNHLYLGNYLCPVCDLAETSWRTVARYCDVISYDFYRFDYEEARLLRLERETGKPVFCGEFSFPAWYDGWRGFGRYWTAYTSSDAESGERYSQFVQAAARDPYCVGLSWFQYHDQPLTGRGPGAGSDLVYGEHYAFGLVTVTDRPKWDLVTRMREANLQAAILRLSAPPGPFNDIAPDYWAAAQIAACVNAGIVGGYPDGTYRPRLAVTRDAMAVFISRALAGGDALVPTGPASATFSDVPTDHWAFRYVEYAVDNGVVSGFPDGSYRPTVAVTRDAMAVFVARAMVGGEAYVPTGPTTAFFPDVPTDHWAFKYVEHLRGEGVTGGYDDGTYRPLLTVTRDQMAVYVQRAFALPW